MSKRSKCECTYGYCCDECWFPKDDEGRCKTAGCLNPVGHEGPCGRERSSKKGVIVITEKDLLS